MTAVEAVIGGRPAVAKRRLSMLSERSSRVIAVRNRKAVFALACAVGALALLVAGAAAANQADHISVYFYAAVPASFVAAMVAVSLARRARFDFQRSLGRLGGNGLATVGKLLGVLALLLSLTAALAIGVYFVLKLAA